MMEYGRNSVWGAIPSLVNHQGRTVINERALRLKPAWLTNDSLVVTANQDSVATMTPPRDRGAEGDMEVWSLSAESTGQFTVQLYIDLMDRALMNGPVESTLVFGSGGNLPGVLGESIFVPAQSSIKVTAADLSGASNTITIVGQGTQMLTTERTPEELRRIRLKPYSHIFWLTYDSGATVEVGASATSNDLMTVPGDAYFEAHGLVYRSDGDFDLELLEGSNRSLMSDGAVQPAPLVAAQMLSVTGHPGNIIPAASLPFWFPAPWLITPSTSIKVRVTDTSGASNTVSVALIGRLLYFPRVVGVTDLTARP